MSIDNQEDPSARRSATINLRVEAETRDLIDSAASALGKTRTEFMIDTARRQAIDTLLDQRLFLLEEDRYTAFTSALDAPPHAGHRLKALMRKKPLWDK